MEALTARDDIRASEREGERAAVTEFLPLEVVQVVIVSDDASVWSRMSGLESSRANKSQLTLEFHPISNWPGGGGRWPCPSQFTFVDHEAMSAENPLRFFIFSVSFFFIFWAWCSLFAPLVFDKMFQIVAHCKYPRNLRLTNFGKCFPFRFRHWGKILTKTRNKEI